MLKKALKERFFGIYAFISQINFNKVVDNSCGLMYSVFKRKGGDEVHQ